MIRLSSWPDFWFLTWLDSSRDFLFVSDWTRFKMWHKSRHVQVKNHHTGLDLKYQNSIVGRFETRLKQVCDLIRICRTQYVIRLDALTIRLLIGFRVGLEFSFHSTRLNTWLDSTLDWIQSMIRLRLNTNTTRYLTGPVHDSDARLSWIDITTQLLTHLVLLLTASVTRLPLGRLNMIPKSGNPWMDPQIQSRPRHTLPRNEPPKPAQPKSNWALLTMAIRCSESSYVLIPGPNLIPTQPSTRNILALAL